MEQLQVLMRSRPVRIAFFVSVDEHAHPILDAAFRCALPTLMAMTEHRAVGSVIGYFQAGGVTANPAARILDDSILDGLPGTSAPSTQGHDLP